MKEQLARIFNALGEVETKGQGTFIIADARRALASIINTMPDEQPEKEEQPEEGEE